ncbi:DUF397 domain-containing protein [Streptomyces cavernicola]|uniref:DUF397 domain-containing protein n=1 Tax=Streptomyces cavernicola TaxID=3043613 RepID=A0ABT6S3C2_9ACTN|nr:DUF397 domain-containing protein [Streptomyces sp. B-S-A6]MDI3402590.1 DUF397 domain-containing protein [Streptomyces sp. B-S-A6]
MPNLYTLPAVDDGAFENFCGGNLGGEHEACIDVAAIPGAVEAFELRDSKPEGVGEKLRVTAAEVDDFVLGWAKKRGLAL